MKTIWVYILPRPTEFVDYGSTFIVSSSMDPGYRPSSSLYSDEPFFLESLVFPSPSSISEAGIPIKMEAVNEIELVRSEVATLKAGWTHIYEALQLSAALTCHMEVLFQSAKERIAVERNKWLANCTAI
jgi:hypothetical protein